MRENGGMVESMGEVSCSRRIEPYCMMGNLPMAVYMAESFVTCRTGLPIEATSEKMRDTGEANIEAHGAVSTSATGRTTSGTGEGGSNCPMGRFTTANGCAMRDT